MGIEKSIAARRPVQGIGINDSDYIVRKNANGKGCPFYPCWANMLKRCSEEYQSSHLTYIGCQVCKEWHSFMAFKAWMELQDWEGKQLDKDFIGCGKLYSPENCVFISGALNNLFNENRAQKGEHLIGATWHKPAGKFMAHVRINGKYKNLGYFTSANEAHAAWYKTKLGIAQSYLASESNPRVRYAIQCGIEKLQAKYGHCVLSPLG